MTAQTETNAVEQGIQKWLQEKLQKQNPAIRDVKVSGFKKPDVGASNETLLFDAVYTENGKEVTLPLVARLQPKGAGVFMSYDLDKQYKAVELLAGTDVLVPELVGYEPNAELLGTPFYIMKRLHGRAIIENPPYYLDGWFAQLSPEDRGTIWRNGIKAAARISRQDWKKLGFSYLLPPAGRTCLQQILEEHRIFLEWIEAKAGHTYPGFWAIYHWLLANQPKGEEPIALIWGDCKPGNLLIEGTEITATIDWEMVRLGNPIHDLAWWITLDNSMSEGLQRLVGMEVPKLPGIPSQEELIALWEKETGFSAKDFEYYELCCAFEFGVTMASLGVNYMNQGLIPKEMEFDINNTCTPLLDRLVAKYNIATK